MGSARQSGKLGSQCTAPEKKRNGTVPDSFLGCTSSQEFKGQVFTAGLLSHDPAKVEDAPDSDPGLPLSAGNTVDNILNDPQVRSLERLLRVKKRMDNEGTPPVRLPGRSLLARRPSDKELSESRASASSVCTLARKLG